ncbi:hypothetical protein Glove_417g43 [Diversispora epigaea]|uniref:CCHC-type domain-containing protein n=1 Tax=Diversispora epigaea TaxID=1348612 RepID=A0A397H017_9GLOM|nr:hypothetical protein Glove_417g43 [Diversispora epigaea]
MEDDPIRTNATCYNCGKSGHITRNCYSNSGNSKQSGHNNNNWRNNDIDNLRNYNPRNNNNNNQGQTPTNYVEIINEKQEERETKKEKPSESTIITPEFLEAYLGKRERPFEGNTPNKEQKTYNQTMNTFGNSKPVTSPKVTWNNTTPKNFKKEQQTTLRPKTKTQIRNTKKSRTPRKLLITKILNQEARTKMNQVLRKLNKVKVGLADQEFVPRTITLNCYVTIDECPVPTVIDSGAAASLISKETMEQLRYNVEEPSGVTIITASNDKTKVLGRIRDFPITVERKTIPIDVEVLEEGSPLLLENNWMTKAGAKDSDYEETNEMEYDPDEENSEEEDIEEVFSDEEIIKIPTFLTAPEKTKEIQHQEIFYNENFRSLTLTVDYHYVILRRFSVTFEGYRF